METPTLVCTRDWGIPGANYYYVNHERKNITLEELAEVGVVDDRTYVHPDLIKPLVEVLAALAAYGYGILIVDAYRSAATYALVRRKYAEQNSEESASRLFNMEVMPHTNGRTIDVDLIDLATGKKIMTRDNAKDGLDASFEGFYRDRDDPDSREFQRLQDLLHRIMFAAGFILGSKREVWHFELPE